MKNPIIVSSDFLNAQLYKYLEAFIRTLPRDKSSEVFNPLMESILFALRNGENPVKLTKRIRRERYKKEPILLPLSDAQAELDIGEIKRLRSLAKMKPLLPGARKLDRYRQEIQQLQQKGASQQDIRIWLRANRNVEVSQPTIHRYLKAIICYEQSGEK